VFVGVSDSAFHTTADPAWRSAGVSRTDAERFDIYRFGYHGISVASVVKHLAVREGMVPRRVIVCHIGSGVSVTAVKNGRSLANSMGYTPASGIMMSSRMSDVSADVVAALMVRKGLTKKDIFSYIYGEGGFYGAAGVKDLRLVLDRAEKNDKAAIEALERFAREIKNYIAMYAMLMDGVDIIVLTATAAERNPAVRQLLVGQLPLLDSCVHEARNEALVNHEGYIHTDSSCTKILVLKTDELHEMYRVVSRF
jgi:acetate kinase